MPCDITFHPVAVETLQHFFFDVFADPSLASKRARELCPDNAKRPFVEHAIYGSLDTWRERLAAGEPCFGQTVAFGCAAVAGYREGYCYGGSSALSAVGQHTPELAACFTPLPKAISGAAALQDDSKGLLWGNYCGSGLLLPETFARLREILADLADRQARSECPPALFGLFDDASRRALELALSRAEGKGLALMEAADLVEPWARRGSTDLDNLCVTPPSGERPSAAAVREIFPCLRERGQRHDP